MATLSPLVYLPRLIPAPQLFIRTSRAEKLEAVPNVKVLGYESGNFANQIHHVAHAIHRGDKLPANSVKVVRATENRDLQRPSVRKTGPLTFLALFGFCISAVLLERSLHYKDGMALLGTIFLSVLGSLTGWANKWRPTANDPEPDPNSPPGSVVIKYPQGAFIVVECEEMTSRYLYFNPQERCIYKVSSSGFYRFLSSVGTLLLMAGVICLANSTIELQCCFAASYMLLNFSYWNVAALSPARHWDLSRLQVTEISVKGGFPKSEKREDDTTPANYTEALWKAIAVTRSTNWVKEAEFAPKTKAWDEWLVEAQTAAETKQIEKVEAVDKTTGKKVETWTIPSWDAKKELGKLLEPETLTHAA